MRKLLKHSVIRQAIKDNWYDGFYTGCTMTGSAFLTFHLLNTAHRFLKIKIDKGTREIENFEV